jgi:hypothetical protein
VVAARPTVSQVRAWDVTALWRQAGEWENAHDEIGGHTRDAFQLADDSTDFWRGMPATPCVSVTLRHQPLSNPHNPR